MTPSPNPQPMLVIHSANGRNALSMIGKMRGTAAL